ncbi:MAG: sugar ABC transporter permease [Chloroflexi bacterium]|nr:sugar ABC transporter permease [Chloroflexota bacterium]
MGAISWLRTLRGRRTLMGYIFIGPFILGVLVWVGIPASTALWLVFQDWNLIAPAKYSGLDNILRLGGDKLFWQALKVTTIYTLASVPLGLLLSFIMALLINQKMRGIALFRTIYYLPSIVPAVANAVLWAWIFNGEFGLLNVMFHYVGLPKIHWLEKPEWALPALILMSLWSVGGAMIIFLAGLQGIPEVLYEAAKIDGAGRLAQLRYITIPLMSPTIFFNLIIGIINSFQVFTAAVLITDGGPQNATMFFVLYLYRVSFRFLEMGYAATLSWVLFFILMLMTILVFKTIGRQVYYQEDV